ncbi:MAG: class I SAM-dependent methyltransferase [bacterium]|nr:class I SAM-dependent methyltransferase [bacterium]
MEIKLFYSKDWADYELLDTGEGEKLERFGPHIFIRPLEDAVWPKSLPFLEWQKADGKFWSSREGGKKGWKMEREIEPKWSMEYHGVKFLASPTPFRHLGFFPEQASHWDFIERALKAEEKNRKEPIKFLNLFGYTGVASLFALRTGAEVTHVDASKQSLNWAKENQALSNMENLPMRIIEDDVIKFLEREEKRGHKYDAVIMDPPKFGRGPKGEVWKIEEMLPQLLLQVGKILSEKPIFVILTSYATDTSPLTLGYALSDAMKNFKGKVEQGELGVLEKSNGRIIPLANTAVWRAT